MFNLEKTTCLKILFLSSFTILLSAYFIQYLLGYQPCNLCIIERVPYALSLIVLVFNHFFKKDQVFYSILLLLIFSFSFLISVYHFGIEQGFISESNVCGSNNSDLTTKEEVLKSLQEINISCKDVAFKIFGFSLTTYNIIVSVFMFLISTKIYLINDEIQK
jgi:disulfide bond formation protein DsbB